MYVPRRFLDPMANLNLTESLTWIRNEPIWMSDIQSLPAEKHPVLSGDGACAAPRLVGLNARAVSSGCHRMD